MKIKSIQLDVPRPNGRIYPKDVMEKAIADFRVKMLCGQTMGELTSNQTVPQNSNINVANVSHIIKDVGIDEENYLWAEITPLETTYGKLLQELMTNPQGFNMALNFVPRGLGTVEDNKVKEYELTAIDAWLDNSK